jgi:undecaprenyl-diphosphatase
MGRQLHVWKVYYDDPAATWYSPLLADSARRQAALVRYADLAARKIGGRGVIVLAPGLPLWDLAQHVTWLAAVVIAVTEGCAIATPLLVLATWFRPAGLRCVVAAVLALIFVILARHAVVAVWFLPRPFVTYHFQPLYPHPADSAFPSLTTGFFAAVGVPAFFAWRPLGWVFAAITTEVAFGCVYVGVHYLVDVLAGAIIGAGCGLAAWLLLGAPVIGGVMRASDRLLGRVRLRPTFAAAK